MDDIKICKISTILVGCCVWFIQLMTLYLWFDGRLCERKHVNNNTFQIQRNWNHKFLRVNSPFEVCLSLVFAFPPWSFVLRVCMHDSFLISCHYSLKTVFFLFLRASVRMVDGNPLGEIFSILLLRYQNNESTNVTEVIQMLLNNQFGEYLRSYWSYNGDSCRLLFIYLPSKRDVHFERKYFWK